MSAKNIVMAAAGAVGAPWDLTYARFLGTVPSKGVEGQTGSTSVTDVAFSSDGTKMYALSAGARVIYQYTLSTAWAVNTASYDIKFFTVISQETTPNAVAFSSDGTRMYVVGSAADTVYQYTLSTAWDVSTASYASKSFSVTTQDTVPTGLAFSADGTKMYVSGDTTDSIYQYTLSTAWDVSTASYASKSLSVTAQDPTPQGVAFSTDGTRMYVVGSSNDTVYQYTLSTAWDLATASYTSNFSVSSQETTPNAVAFSPDGTRMYILGSNTRTVYQYTLTTAWNILTARFFPTGTSVAYVGEQGSQPRATVFSTDGTKMYVANGSDIDQYTLSTAWDVGTASYANKTLDVFAKEPQPSGLAFSTDGTKMYFVGTGYDRVFQYTLSTAWDVTTATDSGLGSPFFQPALESDVSGLYFSSDGLNMYVVGPTSDRVLRLVLSTAWNVSTAQFSGVLPDRYLGGQDSTASGVSFSTDGTKMFYLGITTDRVYLYNLSTAWSVGTSTYSSSSLSVSLQDSVPTAVAFSTDGTKMYVLGTATSRVYQYTLPTAWSFSGATYASKSLSFGELSGSVSDMYFSDDGTKLYILADDSFVVFRFNLSTAWDISTAQKAATPPWFHAGLEDPFPAAVAFSTDGTKMYMLGSSTDCIYQYTLSTAWNVSTASYASKVLNVAPQETGPGGLAFSTDGTKMYLVGDVNDTIYQYTLSTAWDLATASYASKSFSVAALETTPTGLAFSPDGTGMYVVGYTSDQVRQYALSTAWDVSTASYTNKTFSVVAQDSTTRDLYFSSDGTKMYTLGSGNDRVYQYTLSTAWDVSTASYASKFYTVNPLEYTPHALSFSSDGTKMYVAGTNASIVYQFTLSTAWDLATATIAQTGPGYFSVVSEDFGPAGLAFSSDGTKMYMLGATANDRVFEYALSTAWNVETASYSNKSVSVAVQSEFGGESLFFRPDGTRMYFLGSDTDKVFEFSLSTAWDINTASFPLSGADWYTLIGQDSSATGVALSADGTRMFVAGGANSRVYQYALSTAYDPGSSTYTGKVYSTSALGVGLSDVSFSSDGTKMYASNSTNKAVAQINLV